MQTFSFAGSERKFFGACMVVGVISLLAIYLTDDPLHSRFWGNILQNGSFFLGIAFISLFLYAAKIIAYSGWHVQFKRILESYSLFLGLGLIFMIVLGLGTYFGFHSLYEWNQPHLVEDDPIIQGKSPFLNPGWYLFATIVFGGSWFFVARQLRALSLKEDSEGDISFKIHKKMKIWAAIMLPLGGFTSAAAIWLWLMSLDAHWYSTLYGWYTASSWLVAAVGFLILTIIYLKSRGYYPKVTEEHLHDLGKYLFAFSIFWAYLWFSQYMLIWYANIGEATIYFHHRHEHYPTLFYINLVINFALPFLILLTNDSKRRKGTLIFVSIAVIIGHWIDFFLMVKPGVHYTTNKILMTTGMEEAAAELTRFTMPGLLDFGVFIGFIGLFGYFVFNSLTKAALVPAKDPYLEESLHHHVA
ncbi:MAG: hypothetical protein EA411_10445 [Saprospirales bacterium]|nr:MAG: hypothetical protein EA411_10445 [Saprospirales bacterium]